MTTPSPRAVEAAQAICIKSGLYQRAGIYPADETQYMQHAWTIQSAMDAAIAGKDEALRVAENAISGVLVGPCTDCQDCILRLNGARAMIDAALSSATEERHPLWMQVDKITGEITERSEGSPATGREEKKAPEICPACGQRLSEIDKLRWREHPQPPHPDTVRLDFGELRIRSIRLSESPEYYEVELLDGRRFLGGSFRSALDSAMKGDK